MQSNLPLVLQLSMRFQRTRLTPTDQEGFVDQYHIEV